MEESAEITKVIGSFGKWQLRIVIVLCFPGAFHAFHFLVTTFFNPEVDRWCRPPGDLYSNWTVDEWKQYSIPLDEKNTTPSSSCEMYERNYSLVLQNFDDDLLSNFSTTKCKYGWDYDKSLFSHSLENEFDLVCDREALAKTGTSTFNAGIMIGVCITGQLADTFGRKITMMVSLWISIIFGTAAALMPTLEWFFVARFILAVSITGWGTTTYVLLMEFLDKKWRSLIGVYSTFGWVIGYLLVPLYAYLVPDWRHLQLLISLHMIPFVAFWWLVPESVRWLMSRGRVEEAEEIAKEAVKVNNRKVKVDFKSIYANKKDEKQKNATFLDLFRYPKMRTRTLNIWYNWLVNAFVYFGMSQGTADLGGDLFLTFILSGLVEIPAYLICGWVIMRYGRRNPYSVFMVLAGIACMATSAFEKGDYPYDWPIISLAMTGKLCISASFMIQYVYAIELFPTPVRNVGLASASTCAHIAAIVAPYVYLLRHYHQAIPLVMFGLSSFSAGVLILLLPETNNLPLPQTLQEAEML